MCRHMYTSKYGKTLSLCMKMSFNHTVGIHKIRGSHARAIFADFHYLRNGIQENPDVKTWSFEWFQIPSTTRHTKKQNYMSRHVHWWWQLRRIRENFGPHLHDEDGLGHELEHRGCYFADFEEHLLPEVMHRRVFCWPYRIQHTSTHINYVRIKTPRDFVAFCGLCWALRKQHTWTYICVGSTMQKQMSRNTQFAVLKRKVAWTAGRKRRNICLKKYIQRRNRTWEPQASHCKLQETSFAWSGASLRYALSLKRNTP